MDWLRKRPERKPDEPDPLASRNYVVALQRDGRLLMRHLARRSDVAMPELAADGGKTHDTCLDILFAAPELILADPGKMADLVHIVDVLSRRAQPANVRSIRLTSAYLRMSVEDGEPPTQVAKEAKRIVWQIKLLAGIGVAFFVIAIVLLADADYGRRLLQQVEHLRQTEQDNTKALNGLSTTDFRPGPFKRTEPSNLLGQRPPDPASPAIGTALAAVTYQGPRCNDGHELKTSEWQQPITAAAIELCRQKDDIRHRLNLAYVGLADWNCWNYRFNWLVSGFVDRGTLDCGIPMGGLPSTAVPAAVSTDLDQPGTTDQKFLISWRSHETRVNASIAVITGFALPMLLGFLGGCAFVFRRFNEKLGTWNVEPHDGKQAWVRVLLAALLGGLVGVIWTSDQSVNIGGFSLSLAAAAFFIGFSVEAVFTLINKLTTGLLSAVGPRTTDSVTGSPTLSTGQSRATPAAPPLATGQPIPAQGPASGPAPLATGQPTPAQGPASGSTPLATGQPTPAQGAASGNTTAPATGGVAFPPAQPLRVITEKLGAQRQVLDALVQLGAGSPVAANAATVLDMIDRALRSMQPVLNDPSAAGYAAALQQAGELLRVAENSGLPGLLADSVAALKGAANFATPVIAGIPGGPIGIIGGIVLGGLQLAGDEQKFQAMKVALMRQPFDPGLQPGVPDAATALAALEASPLMSARVPAPHDPVFAMNLMQRILQRDTNELTPARQLAVTLLQPGDPLGLAGHFESPVELGMAIEEYRGGMVFAEAVKRLDGSVAVPDPETGITGNVDMQALARSVLALHADPLASTAIENAMAVTEALRKLPFDPQTVAQLVLQALAQVPSTVANAREVRAA